MNCRISLSNYHCVLHDMSVLLLTLHTAGQTEGRDATEERAREVLLFRVR